MPKHTSNNVITYPLHKKVDFVLSEQDLKTIHRLEETEVI